MNNNQHSDLKNKLSKWLFAAAFLLSFFTFSGLVLQSQAKYESPKTTLVVNTKTGSAKSISYNRASAQNKPAWFPFQPFTTLELGRIYTRQMKTRISILSSKGMQLKQFAFFYQPKTISSSTDGEPAIFLG